MMRIARLLLVVGVMLAVAAAPGWAQTQMPPAPAAPANATPASLEGTVKKVDQNAKTVLVSSGLFGLFGRTLEVTGDTQIQVEGRQATLMEADSSLIALGKRLGGQSCHAAIRNANWIQADIRSSHRENLTVWHTGFLLRKRYSSSLLLRPFLAEAHRCLRPEGRLLLAVPVAAR